MSTTTMASAICSFGMRICTPQAALQQASAQFSPFAKKQSFLNLTSSQFVITPLVLSKNSSVATPLKSRPLTIVCAKGYKMKTHKASAKRFRVTGTGKIVRRRAGKQHLLRKKNTKRRNRLSKTVQVDRSDYDNVIGALPYLKVNRAN